MNRSNVGNVITNGMQILSVGGTTASKVFKQGQEETALNNKRMQEQRLALNDQRIALNEQKLKQGEQSLQLGEGKIAEQAAKTSRAEQMAEKARIGAEEAQAKQDKRIKKETEAKTAVEEALKSLDSPEKQPIIKNINFKMSYLDEYTNRNKHEDFLAENVIEEKEVK